jgi:hypothetical protein
MAVFAYWRHRTRSRTDDRLRDECRDSIRAEFENLLLELVRETLRERILGLVGTLLAICIAWTHVMRIDQERQERLAAPGVAADRQCPEGVAVIALRAAQ